MENNNGRESTIAKLERWAHENRVAKQKYEDGEMTMLEFNKFLADQLSEHSKIIESMNTDLTQLFKPDGEYILDK